MYVYPAARFVSVNRRVEYVVFIQGTSSVAYILCIAGHHTMAWRCRGMMVAAAGSPLEGGGTYEGDVSRESISGTTAI